MRNTRSVFDIESRIDLILEAVILGGAFCAPFLIKFDPYYLHIFTMSLFMGGLALSWNVLGGYCGQISFGHAAFFGVGAYVSSLLSIDLGINPFVSIFVAAVSGIISALVAGYVCFRLRGAYFALTMLAYAEILRLVTLNLKGLTYGPEGLLGIPSLPNMSIGKVEIDFYASKSPNYYFVLIIVCIIVFTTMRLRQSRFGLGQAAIADDEDVAESMGINTFKYKMISLFISAFFTSLLGAFYAHYIHFLTPHSAFHVGWSILPIVASLFGGMKFVMGPVLGAIVMWIMDEFVFKMIFERGHLLFFGIVLALVIIFMPKGFLGSLAKRLKDLLSYSY